MEFVDNVPVGILIVLIGAVYGIWNLKKKPNENPNTFSKVDNVNS